MKSSVVLNGGAEGSEVALVEIGGTVGDIESLPFLEAIRQLRIEVGLSRSLFIHLTLVPYIATAGENKTKPTQHSVKELRSIGIQPDILICRSTQPLPDPERLKIALFTNVSKSDVISLEDVSSIYKIPLHLHNQSLDKIVVDKLQLTAEPADLSEWQAVVTAQNSPRQTVKIAMVGKYTEHQDAYKSLNEALLHAGIHTRTKVNIAYLDAEIIETHGTKVLTGVDAILIPGGFGKRGIAGKIQAIQYARTHNIPYLGICLGLQVAVIEFARNVANMEMANSTEFDENTPVPVIGLITEWMTNDGDIEMRDKATDLGGTMRLGGQICLLEEGSLAKSLYRKTSVIERHRHRYEVNNNLLPALQAAGLSVSGYSTDKSLVEIIELPTHPWFIACQFHPEFTSTPRDGHPLFEGFIRAANDYATKEDNHATV